MGVSLNRRKSLPLMTCLAALFFIVWMWVPTSGHLQEPEKGFEKLTNYRNEPLKITSMKAANRKVRFGEKITGEDDWLKSAELTIKNVSGKDIVFVEVDLNFPETKTSGDEMSFPLRFGSPPGLPTGSPAMILRIDDEATLGLQGKRYEELVRFVEHRHSISTIGKVVVDVQLVIFADGTAWSRGTFRRRDPNNPNSYIPN
jgi:hypothetical protein